MDSAIEAKRIHDEFLQKILDLCREADDELAALHRQDNRKTEVKP